MKGAFFYSIICSLCLLTHHQNSCLRFHLTEEIKITFLVAYCRAGFNNFKAIEPFKIFNTLHKYLMGFFSAFSMHTCNITSFTSTFSSVYSWETYITFEKNSGEGTPTDSLSLQHDHFHFYICNAKIFLMLFAFRCLQEIWWPDLHLAEQLGMTLGAMEMWWAVLLPRACPAATVGTGWGLHWAD